MKRPSTGVRDTQYKLQSLGPNTANMGQMSVQGGRVWLEHLSIHLSVLGGRMWLGRLSVFFGDEECSWAI